MEWPLSASIECCQQQIEVFERPTESLGQVPVHYVSPVEIEATEDHGIHLDVAVNAAAFAHLLQHRPKLIGQGKTGCTGNAARNVGHTVMRYSMLHENRLLVVGEP